MEIPKEVKNVIDKLETAGFEAYIVGGCVRDSLLGVKPKDWDIATNAKPEQTAKLFPRTFAVKKFGLVVVLTDSPDETLKEIEIMPYRRESKYTDKRHPDKIEWAASIEDDLARRDFTVNALVGKITGNDSGLKIIDLFSGKKDLDRKIIRTVGEAEQRFNEDALRLMRAVRFAVTLGPGWQIEKETEKGIKKKASLLSVISKERIRDELVKIIMSSRAMQGINLLRDLGLLRFIIPELLESVGVEQNKHHIYNCYEHAVRSLDYTARQNYNLHVRLAALLHDIAKPRTKEGKGEDATFYNHEVVGARMAEKILRRLCFPKKDIEKIRKLVRYHLFYYNVGEVTESSVRRLVRNVGQENINDLLQLRYADRIGSGCPKACPYKLRHLQYLIEKTSKDPISVGMLKINGNEIMEIMGISPGPKIGQILDILFAEILDSPEKNKNDYLRKRVSDLGKKSDKELKELADTAKASIQEVRMKKDKMIKDKYWVR